MVESSEARLNQAIRLSQQGEKKEARKILLQLIQENSRNEYAWLWLIDVCDSDRERKAVLSRGLKVNPNSKLLQTAMKKFVDTGSLTLSQNGLEERSLRSEKSDVATEPEPSPKKPDPLTKSASDLDWISLEEDAEKDAIELDTISDDEFSRLSQQFFIGDTDEDSDADELELEELESLEEVDSQPSTGSNSGLFLLDEIMAKENEEDSSVNQSDPFLEFDEFDQKESSPVAIEDRLKGAFEDEDGKKRKRLKIRMPDFKAMSRLALVILVSTFWLVVFVLAGLFAVQYFELDEYLSPNQGGMQPTITNIVPEEEQVTDQPAVEESEEPQATETPTPTPVPTVLGRITSNNYMELTALEKITQPFPILISESGELFAILDLQTIHLQDNSGAILWSQEMETSRAIGGGFSDDGSLLGIFLDDLTLKVWNVEDGTLVNDFRQSPEMEIVYADIPYLPGDAKAFVDFSFDNEYVAAAFWGGVTAWQINTTEVVHEYALPQSILVSSFNSGLDLNSALDFHPTSLQLTYGIRENVYLVDLSTNLVLQNWKTQFVGALAWYDDDRILEVGYPLNALDSYLAIWKNGNLNPSLKVNCLNASRGQYLPRHVIFRNTAILLVESEDLENNQITVKLISLIDGLEIGSLPLETYQPLLGMVEMPSEDIVGIWAQIPREGFGVSDQVEFWDIDTLELVSNCEECSFLSGILADQYSLHLNEEGTLLTQYAEGIGLQQLGIPTE